MGNALQDVSYPTRYHLHSFAHGTALDQQYQAIRKAELFDTRGWGDQYDPNHRDERNLANLPLVFLANMEVIGCVRLDKLPSPVITVRAVRLFAITRSKQRSGHGRAMHELIEAQVHSEGVSLLLLNAAQTAVGFYQKLGYQYCRWKDPSQGLDKDTVPMAKFVQKSILIR